MSGTSDIGPFGIVPRWVRHACKGQPWALALYSTLADMADRTTDGGWTIGREQLADELGTSAATVDRAVKVLVDAEALVVVRNRKGKEWTWSRYFIRAVKSSPVGQVPPPVSTGVVTGDDVPENPLQEPPSTESSSLRSEGADNAIRETRNEVREIATAYWDWHVAENGGKPAQDFKALMAVARACLKREYPPDEILAAMKLERRSLTAAKVIDRIGLTRREAEQRPATSAIPAEVVRAMAKARPWFEKRWPGVSQREWAQLSEIAAANVRRGFGIGETMIRLAIASRDRSGMDGAFWLMNIDIPRFPGELADVPGSMEVAYRNRGWKP